MITIVSPRLEEQPGLIKDRYPAKAWIELHGWLAWSNEVIEELVSSKTDKDCWSNEVIENPLVSLKTDRHRYLPGYFAWVFAEANSSKKPDIRPKRMSGAVTRHSLLPYITEYKSRNFGQFWKRQFGGSTSTRVQENVKSNHEATCSLTKVPSSPLTNFLNNKSLPLLLVCMCSRNS